MFQLRPNAALPEPITSYDEVALRFCREWRSGQLTFALHTSGSTGTPKPIELTRGQMIASARLTGETFGLQPGDSALCCLNVAYVAGVMMLVRAMELELTLTVVEPSGNPLLHVAENEKFNLCAFVPLQLQTILEKTPERLTQLNGAKAILVGGAAVSGSLEAQLQVLRAPVFSTYGMTETVSHVAIRRLNGPERTETYHVLRGVEAGADQRDCLWVRGGMTDFATVQTNDVVEFTDVQTFRWLGRFDSIINSGGVKVVPERAETVLEPLLREVGFVGRFFVCGVPDQRLGQRVAMVVEGKPLSSHQLENVRKAVEENLSRYEVPREWVFLEKFPETPTGKIDRRQAVRDLTRGEAI